MTDTFRCSLASAADHEEQAGTAPTQTRWLFVEQPGPWGRDALHDSRLPAEVADLLAAQERRNVRVQLIRHATREAQEAAGGLRVIRVDLGGPSPVVVGTAELDDVGRLLEQGVDLAGLDDLLTPYAGTLWLVCANGRRDVCCAELGRPVAAALVAHPDVVARGGAGPGAGEVWETTHLGGHRFAATAVHLPSGLLLGRLDPAAASAAHAELAAGRMPLEHVRGRIGVPLIAQYGEVWLRREHDWRGLDDVSLRWVGGEGDEGVAEFATPAGPLRLTVAAHDGPPRLVSCPGPLDQGRGSSKPTLVMQVVAVETVP